MTGGMEHNLMENFDLVRPFADMLSDAPVSKEQKIDTMKKVLATVVECVIPIIAEKLFVFVDKDNSRGMQKDEIMAVFRMFAATQSPPEDFAAYMAQMADFGADFVFAILDTNRNGVIEPEEVADFFVRITKLAAETTAAVIEVLKTELADTIIDNSVDKMMEEMDQDKDGKLSRDEFHLSEAPGALLGMSGEFNRAAGYDPVAQEFIKVREAVFESSNQWTPEEFRELLKVVLHGRLDTAEELTYQYGPMLSESGGFFGNGGDAFKNYVGPQIDKMVQLLKSDNFDGVIYALADAVFALCDCDQDGTLTRDELMAYGAMFNAYGEGEEGMAQANQTVELLWSSVDTDGDGFFDKDELKTKARQLLNAAMALAHGAIDIAAAVFATWESTIFREGIDGCKMLCKIDPDVEEVGAVDKQTLIRVAMHMSQFAQVGGDSKLAGTPYNPLVMWCMGMQIARGATQEDFERDGCLSGGFH
jgi:Ca2+-binding EF-hand superfamily protein